MSNKTQTIYLCSKCGAQSLKWNGRCLECGGWGTMKMETVDAKAAGKEKLKTNPAEIIDFNNMGTEDFASQRIKTGIAEVDRVLGGGIVPGSLILLSGEPGIGKSTIVAQIAGAVSSLTPNPSPAPAAERERGAVIYASGEESAAQIKSRFDRLNCGSDIKFISETNVEKIISAVETQNLASLLIVDSIQTVYSGAVESEAGSVSQIRASAVSFLEMAKHKNISVILIGHITKDGSIAGPKSLEHIVDTVIYLETENRHGLRILRANKNRFGSVNELGVFEMTGTGFKEIKNPGSIFLETSDDKISGSVISCVMEGTRPFLVEIQALVTKTVFGYPQRKASGFDLNRLQVLAAVLTKRAKINLTNQDIILNVVGGLKINDPALDLAICLAITSSLLNQVINRKTIVLGEVGLGGEVRNVSKLEQRLKEAEKLGFTKAIISDSNIKSDNIKLEKVKNINDIVKKL
jgi:DNA repair protein RadA/Sms